MLPNRVLSTTVESATFLSPKTSVPKLALTDVCPGPVAIGDSSQGLNYQTWGVSTDGGANIIFTPATSGSASTVFTASDTLVWVAGCFDQNSHPVVAYQVTAGSFFRWFNTTTNAFVVTALSAGVVGPMIALDDFRPPESSSSDVIVSYLNGLNLCFRAQRDNYAIEYVLTTVGTGSILTQAGMNKVGRFQFQIQTLVASQVLIFTRFVASRVFKPILLTNAGNIKPKIWRPHDNISTR